MLFHYPHDYNKIEVFIILIIGILLISGYFMNFQNLWEYWPTSGQFSDVPIQWILSIISVFIAPLAVITGWVF